MSIVTFKIDKSINEVLEVLSKELGLNNKSAIIRAAIVYFIDSNRNLPKERLRELIVNLNVYGTFLVKPCIRKLTLGE